MKITPPDNDPTQGQPTAPAADAGGLPGAEQIDEVAAAFAEKFARATDPENPFPEIVPADNESDDGDAGDSGTDAAGEQPTDAPVVDEQPASGDATAAPATPSAEHLSVPLPDGTTYDLTPEDAQGYIALGAWAQNLPPETRQAFAAIEGGQAVAITRADYEQFEAWRSTRAHSPGTQAAAPTQDTWAHLEDAGVDPVIIAQLRAQEQTITRLQQPAPADHTAANARLQQDMHSYETGEANWASTRGITDETTLKSLRDVAIRHKVIPKFIEDGRLYSPTGVLLRDADLEVVAAQAMNYALATNAELHSEVLTRQTQSAAPTSPSVSDQRVAAKKARAGSLAAAPSTAVPSPSGPTTNNVQAMTEAMAGFISQRMSGD